MIEIANTAKNKLYMFLRRANHKYIYTLCFTAQFFTICDTYHNDRTSGYKFKSVNRRLGPVKERAFGRGQLNTPSGAVVLWYNGAV